MLSRLSPCHRRLTPLPCIILFVLLPARGDVPNAFKCYVRTRDYCQTGKHVIDMCLNIIKTSIALGNYVHVANYVQKAEGSPELGADPSVQAKLRVAAGLSLLDSRKFKLAARKFCETPFELGTEFSDVVSPQDVGTYGGLCALATFSRQELRTKVLENIGFLSFLELVPELREIINDFYASRYATCLSALERLRAPLRLDIHLWDHVDSLCEQIRQRALVQFVQPFTSANLHLMAGAFNTTVAGIEKEVAQLIQEGLIQAQIDSHNKVLFARHADQRNSTFLKAATTGESALRQHRGPLLSGLTPPSLALVLPSSYLTLSRHARGTPLFAWCPLITDWLIEVPSEGPSRLPACPSGEDFQRETRALLLRARLLQGEMVLKGKPGRGGGGQHPSMDKVWTEPQSDGGSVLHHRSAAVLKCSRNEAKSALRCCGRLAQTS